MKKIIKTFSKCVLSMAMFVSTLIVNATCWYKLYQEELPAEFDKLKKHD